MIVGASASVRGGGGTGMSWMEGGRRMAGRARVETGGRGEEEAEVVVEEEVEAAVEEEAEEEEEEEEEEESGGIGRLFSNWSCAREMQ